MSVLSRLLGRETDDQLLIEPMRRRHLADVLEIEQVSYPKPSSLVATSVTTSSPDRAPW